MPLPSNPHPTSHHYLQSHAATPRAFAARFSANLYPEQQVPVGMFQLLLPVLQLLGALLFPLQLADVIHRRLQDRSLVPAHIPLGSTQKDKVRLCSVAVPFIPGPVIAPYPDKTPSYCVFQICGHRRHLQCTRGGWSTALGKRICFRERGCCITISSHHVNFSK